MLLQSVMKQLVTSFVLQRIDYCNSLLVNLPASTMASLQRVQNDAARLILGLDRRAHITSALKKNYTHCPFNIEFNQNCRFYEPVFSSPLSTVHHLFSQHHSVTQERTSLIDHGSISAEEHSQLLTVLSGTVCLNPLD